MNKRKKKKKEEEEKRRRKKEEEGRRRGGGRELPTKTAFVGMLPLVLGKRRRGAEGKYDGGDDWWLLWLHISTAERDSGRQEGRMIAWTICWHCCGDRDRQREWLIDRVARVRC